MKLKAFFTMAILLAGVSLGKEPAQKTGNEPDYAAQRRKMIYKEIFHRGFTDKRLLEAFAKVKRHLFVRKELWPQAYGDHTLDIGEDQIMNRPYIVAMTTSVINPTKEKKVLEVGTGSGYHTAILAELVDHVYTIEISEHLSKDARKRLAAMGYKNITFRVGDGYKGWIKYAPYDAIIVTCSEDHIPQPLMDQLAVGGRMIIPVSFSDNVIELIYLTKLDANGGFDKQNMIPIRTTPMIRTPERMKTEKKQNDANKSGKPNKPNQ